MAEWRQIEGLVLRQGRRSFDLPTSLDPALSQTRLSLSLSRTRQHHHQKKQKRRPQQRQQRDPAAGPIPPPPQPPSTLDARFAQASAAAEAVAEGRPPPPSDEDFERKIARLAREAAAKKAAAEEAKLGLRGVGGVGGGGGSMLDGSAFPDYDSPPPLSRTIASAMTGSDAAANTNEGMISNGSLTAAASAIFLAAVFVFTSGGFGGGGSGGGDDDGALQRISPASSAFRQRTLSDAEREEARAQLARFEAALVTKPTDAEALRGAANAAAALGGSEATTKTLSLLERLVGASPRDPEAWAALGDARAMASDGKGAVAAFERARAETAGAPPLSLVAAAAGARAVSGDHAGAASDVAAERSAALERGDGEEAYSLALLQAKVLSEWPRHSSEAERIYAELTEARPGDFRGWVARAVLARSEGRAGDAARYFLRAKAAAADAGEGAKQAVDAISKGLRG